MQLSAPDRRFYRDQYRPDEYYHRLHDIGITAVEMTPPERWQAARDAGLGDHRHNRAGHAAGTQ